MDIAKPAPMKKCLGLHVKLFTEHPGWMLSMTGLTNISVVSGTMPHTKC